MDWKNYWDPAAEASNSLSQVGRLNANQEIAISDAAKYIIRLLDLQKDEQILDVCCGNGLITGYISNTGFKVTGIDLSQNLINQAKQNYPHIHFEQQNALSFNLNTKFDKIYLAFSFQYFDSYDLGKKVIENLILHANSGAKILLTDIPDKNRWGIFYNSFLKKVFYFKQKLTGKQTMGKFWSEKELIKICDELSVVGKLLVQPTHLPYQHYRFDFMVTKN